VRRQQDLAQRLASLKGRDGEDDPLLKARMRDLEEEQRQIREDLNELLADIENHVAQLPDEEQFDRLRETATEFVEALRDSGAAEAMADAEAALAEFNGTRGHEKAKEAAEILARFLSQCEGMGNAAGGCLVFRPGMGDCLGQTVAQLLAQMGMGSGSGSGFGMGQGGYSARRGGNVGLYGGMPGMIGMESGAGRSDGRSESTPGAASRGVNPDEPSYDDLSPRDGAAGAGEGTVPVRYRRRVGQYFRRVAEEVPDQ